MKGLLYRVKIDTLGLDFVRNPVFIAHSLKSPQNTSQKQALYRSPADTALDETRKCKVDNCRQCLLDRYM